MKQLYVVEVTQTVVVVAKDKNDAAEEARSALRNGGDDPDFHVEPMRYMPGEWEIDCIPYGEGDPSDPDRTVGQWIEMGAAPSLPKP